MIPFKHLTSKLKKSLQNKELTFGSWLTIPHRSIIEIFAKSGFDWLVIDLEHSPIGIDQTAELIAHIQGNGMQALVRVNKNQEVIIKSVLDAGADGIMIHSRKTDPGEIIEFCQFYRALSNRKALVVVPSSYNSITEPQLVELGVDIVIYANHLLRSAYPAMQKTAYSILENGRSLECDSTLMSISEILNLIPGTN